MHRKKSLPLTVISILVVLAVWAYRERIWSPAPGAGEDTTRTPSGSPPDTPRTADGPAGEGERAILDAFRAGHSNVLVEAPGLVSKVLSDDREGSRHQRFILRLPSGHTVLVAHNIDLAPRVPLSEGDPVTVRGEYEWNREGGVVHWTHRDPAGRHTDGYVEHHGRRFE